MAQKPQEFVKIPIVTKAAETVSNFPLSDLQVNPETSPHAEDDPELDNIIGDTSATDYHYTTGLDNEQEQKQSVETGNVPSEPPIDVEQQIIAEALVLDGLYADASANPDELYDRFSNSVLNVDQPISAEDTLTATTLLEKYLPYSEDITACARRSSVVRYIKALIEHQLDINLFSKVRFFLSRIRATKHEGLSDYITYLNSLEDNSPNSSSIDSSAYDTDVEDIDDFHFLDKPSSKSPKHVSFEAQLYSQVASLAKKTTDSNIPIIPPGTPEPTPYKELEQFSTPTSDLVGLEATTRQLFQQVDGPTDSPDQSPEKDTTSGSRALDSDSLTHRYILRERIDRFKSGDPPVTPRKQGTPATQSKPSPVAQSSTGITSDQSNAGRPDLVEKIQRFAQKHLPSDDEVSFKSKTSLDKSEKGPKTGDSRHKPQVKQSKKPPPKNTNTPTIVPTTSTATVTTAATSAGLTTATVTVSTATVPIVSPTTGPKMAMSKADFEKGLAESRKDVVAGLVPVFEKLYDILNPEKQSTKKIVEAAYMLPKAFDGTKPGNARNHWNSFTKYVEFQQAQHNPLSLDKTLQMFSFTLTDLAYDWFQQNRASFTDIDDLCQKFLTRFNAWGQSHQEQLAAWNKLVFDPQTQDIEQFKQDLDALATMLSIPQAQILIKFKEAMPREIQPHLLNIVNMPDAMSMARQIVQIYKASKQALPPAAPMLLHAAQSLSHLGTIPPPPATPTPPPIPPTLNMGAENHLNQTPQYDSQQQPQYQRGRGQYPQRRGFRQRGGRGRGQGPPQNYYNNLPPPHDPYADNYQDDYQYDPTYEYEYNYGYFPEQPRGRGGRPRGGRGGRGRGDRGGGRFRGGRRGGGRRGGGGRGGRRGGYQQYEHTEEELEQKPQKAQTTGKKSLNTHTCEICHEPGHLEIHCMPAHQQLQVLLQKMGDSQPSDLHASGSNL